MGNSFSEESSSRSACAIVFWEAACDFFAYGLYLSGRGGSSGLSQLLKYL